MKPTIKVKVKMEIPNDGSCNECPLLEEVYNFDHYTDYECKRFNCILQYTGNSICERIVLPSNKCENGKV